jgi:RsiW-degrading membrane proteinase PrsW (M82 family)
MTLSIVRAVALALAWGWACALLYVSLALSDGWASRAALGKGAVLALFGIALSSPFALGFGVFAQTMRSPLASAAANAFFSAGLPEEGGRLVALILLMRMMTTRDPREYFAGVVAAGLAFGVVENLLYLESSKTPIVLGGPPRLRAVHGVRGLAVCPRPRFGRFRRPDADDRDRRA